MSRPSIEDLVAEFLDAALDEPALTASAFAERHPDRRDELLAAIRATLDAVDLLPAEDAAPSPPQAVGPYRVLRTLGRGGMGVVYEVERDGARYALKWLPMAPLIGPRVHERLRRESALLDRLSHPNIVRVHDSGIVDEAPYLVMELVDGETLTAATATMPLQQRLQLCEQLCRAVHAAHTAGVVHRDLKPQNVLVRRDGSPVLLDFGLGMADELPTLTATGDLVGTPRYMAPEQVAGAAADARTDVYALGLMLYEVALGRPAFAEASREQVFAAIARARFPRPRRVDASLPVDLEKVILTALAHDAGRRFPTAAAMADDLQRLLAGKPVQARPPGVLARGWLWARVNPARSVASVLGFALAAALVAAWAAPRPIDAAVLQTARVHYLQGIVDWLEDRPERARDELAFVLRVQPRQRAAAALAAHLQAGNPPDLGALQSALVGCQRDALTSVVAGLRALDARDYESAEPELVAASVDLPPSRRLAETLGDVHLRLGRNEDAERDYHKALAIGPESARLWSRLAEVYRDLENLDAGIEAGEAALRLGGQTTGRSVRVLAGLYERRGDHDRAEALLHRALADDPNDGGTHYLLGHTLDSQHRVACIASYRRALELIPEHTLSMVCLANLYSGADRGHCKGCDRVYSEHPELFDPDAALRLLLAALHTHGAGNRGVLLSILAIANRLPDRKPIVAALTELTEGKEKTTAVLNLEWLLRRLELNEGVEGR